MNYYYGKQKCEDCGCYDKMRYDKYDRYEDCRCKKDNDLDDIKDLLKKILEEKKDKHDDKHDKHDKHDKKCKDDKECEVVTVTFDLDDHQVEFVSPANGVFGCSIIPNQTLITEATRCLLNSGFKIVSYVAATELSEAGDTALGTYTFVRCR